MNSHHDSTNYAKFMRVGFCRLAYLHEDSEPGIVHQHLKSSNILLDKQWSPKISDFGLSNFLGPEWNHIVAPSIGMSGFVKSSLQSLILCSYLSEVLDMTNQRV